MIRCVGRKISALDIKKRSQLVQDSLGKAYQFGL